MNRGEKIFIRLRPASDKSSFLPLEESLVGTLLHELVHNSHQAHNKDFYDFLDKLQDEYDALRSGGYSGEGFMSDGKKTSVSHNLPLHLARAKAVEEAEKRSRLAQIMGPAGGRTLGGIKPLKTRLPRELMAEAAERRARDANTCGHGEGNDDEAVAEEMQKADDLSTSLDEGQQKSQTNVGPTIRSYDPEIEVVSGPSIPKTISRKKAPPQLTSILGKRSKPPSPVRKASRSTNDKQQEVWSCQLCTFENENSLGLTCAVCGAERGGNRKWNLSDFQTDEKGSGGHFSLSNKFNGLEQGWYVGDSE